MIEAEATTEMAPTSTSTSTPAISTTTSKNAMDYIRRAMLLGNTNYMTKAAGSEYCRSIEMKDFAIELLIKRVGDQDTNTRLQLVRRTLIKSKNAPVLMLPYISQDTCRALELNNKCSIQDVVKTAEKKIRSILGNNDIGREKLEELRRALFRLNLRFGMSPKEFKKTIREHRSSNFFV